MSQKTIKPFLSTIEFAILICYIEDVNLSSYFERQF